VGVGVRDLVGLLAVPSALIGLACRVGSSSLEGQERGGSDMIKTTSEQARKGKEVKRSQHTRHHVTNTQTSQARHNSR
jgi:hypothetical protein